MNTELFQKIKYIFHILFNFQNGIQILCDSYFKVPITRLVLSDGMVILGDKKSLLLEITDEIFFKNVYTPEEIEIKKGDLVVDIGANVGIFSLFSLKKGAKKVYAYEPLAKNVDKLSKNLRINGFNNFVVTKEALSNTSGKIRFFKKEHDPHGFLSLAVKKSTATRRESSVYVNTTTLKKVIDYILKKELRENIDLLKIDCEGSEGEIFLSTPSFVWKKISKVSLEYHDNMSSLNHKIISKKLRANKFKVRIKRIDKHLGYIYAWRKPHEHSLSG